MSGLLLVPVLLSFLVLAAHFLRAGLLPLTLIFILVPGVLLLKKRWVPPLLQVLLVLGGFEWVRTVTALVIVRREAGEPWTRMAIILGSVALITVLSSLVFRAKTLQRRYNPEPS